jgi:hypothetical protein
VEEETMTPESQKGGDDPTSSSGCCKVCGSANWRIIDNKEEIEKRERMSVKIWHDGWIEFVKSI